MELSIPLRGDVQKFQGTVVMVREIPGGYDIGLWLATADDASRARLVEEICHLECYLQGKRDNVRVEPKVSPKPRSHFPSAFPQPLAN